MSEIKVVDIGHPSAVEPALRFQADGTVLIYDVGAEEYVPLDSGSGAADFSNTATGTYTDGGVDFKFIQFNSSGTLTVTKEGFADVFVISGGGTGFKDFVVDSGNNAGAGAGGLLNRPYFLEAITHTVTVGGAGGNSSFGSIATTAAGQNGTGNVGGAQGDNDQGRGFAGFSAVRPAVGGGAGGNASANTPGVGVVSSITGTAVTYGLGGSPNPATPTPAANTGGGGNSGNPPGIGSDAPGGSGVVIIRVRT